MTETVTIEIDGWSDPAGRAHLVKLLLSLAGTQDEIHIADYSGHSFMARVRRTKNGTSFALRELGPAGAHLGTYADPEAMLRAHAATLLAAREAA